MLKRLALVMVVISQVAIAQAQWEELQAVRIAQCSGSDSEDLRIYVLASLGEETPGEGKALFIAEVGEEESILTARYFGNDDGSFLITGSMGLEITVKQGDSYETPLSILGDTNSVTCSGKW